MYPHASAQLRHCARESLVPGGVSRDKSQLFSAPWELGKGVALKGVLRINKCQR